MIKLREPKFKVGERVIDKNGDVSTVINVSHYYFDKHEYWYNTEKDETIRLKPESNLEPYQEKPKTVWDLKKDDTCYVVDVDGEVAYGTWSNIYLNNNCRKIGNVFLTKEEAEFDAECRKIETEMLRLGGRKSFKFNGKNYGMYYSNDLYVKSYEIAYPGLIYFDSKKEVDNAIEKIRKDRILKYIFRFGVEE